MTFEELLDIYYKAEARGTDRDAVRAVVEALRDDATRRANAMMWDGQDFEDFFDAILASDGEGKAAGGITREGALQHDRPDQPEPAADPSVCEWTKNHINKAAYDTGCGLYDVLRAPEMHECNCDKPIKFKEGSE